MVFFVQFVISGVVLFYEVSFEEVCFMYIGMVQLSYEGLVMICNDVVEVLVLDGEMIKCCILVFEGCLKFVIVYYYGGGWVIGNINDYEMVGCYLVVCM